MFTNAKVPQRIQGPIYHQVFQVSPSAISASSGFGVLRSESEAPCFVSVGVLVDVDDMDLTLSVIGGAEAEFELFAGSRMEPEPLADGGMEIEKPFELAPPDFFPDVVLLWSLKTERSEGGQPVDGLGGMHTHFSVRPIEAPRDQQSPAFQGL